MPACKGHKFEAQPT